MAEPTTTTATIATLSAVSLLPFINGNALLGAVLGAAFIATFEKDLNAYQRIRNMLLATGIGYISAPLITEHTFLKTDAVAALLTSTLCLFVLIKVVDWVKTAKLSDILNIFRGGKP
ncbi:MULTISPECIES: putative holin [Acinetobacter]|uniref:Phage holin n=1 Tax=Acinetobacter tandoii DSM 14970 = CIP 107469 TaxID=1120927 RepID=R9AS40_9GAMM|nr:MULTISPECIES: putative holin [Acinetobacter]EOR05042.1 hypothetical protein I593_03126 [Acinetobacter tandoii DSM 14970 = CIP 107469]MCW1386450.1 phage holin family protein [Acinetobacter baumannii]PWB14237.1 hypothetical protein DCO44_10015 [Acinetobacter sp. AM]